MDGVCELVFWAKSNNWGIILVEFSGFGQTTQRILDAIGAYQHVDTVIKYTEDGGAEVCQCLKNNPCWSLNLLVCGVFGDACVPATVRSLFEHNSLVEMDVVIDLVVPEYESDYRVSYHDEGPPERSISLASLRLQKSCVA